MTVCDFLGTGKWTAISALDCGMPVTLIGESVFARCLSSLKNERIKASKVLKGPTATSCVGDVNKFIEDVRQALYASKIISYAQGFMLLRQAAKVRSRLYLEILFVCKISGLNLQYHEFC